MHTASKLHAPASVGGTPAAVPRTTPPTSAITAVAANGDAPQPLIG
jgi:hypothetical protein